MLQFLSPVCLMLLKRINNLWLALHMTWKTTFYICRSFIKRSLSDGHMLSESDSPIASTDVGRNQPLSEIAQGGSKGISESAPAIPTCESEISYCRYAWIVIHILVTKRMYCNIFKFRSQEIKWLVYLYWCTPTTITFSFPKLRIVEVGLKGLYVNLTSSLTMFFCRFTSPVPCKQLFSGMQEDQCLQSDNSFYDEHDYDCNFSNFLNSDWLSSSGNSCEEETSGRYLFLPSQK